MSDLERLIPSFDRGFDALEDGDIEEFMVLVHDQADPDCEFHSGIGSVVGGGTFKGVEGIRDWFSDLIASTAERRWLRRDWQTHGEDVLVLLADFEITGASSGAPAAAETGAVFEYKNGRCVRIVSFTSHTDALAEAKAVAARA